MHGVFDVAFTHFLKTYVTDIEIPLQYKFIVDGEWRHDENQPFVSGTYGTVNTVLLTRDSNYIPTVLSPQMPSGSSMDVDNVAFQRLV